MRSSISTHVSDGSPPAAALLHEVLLSSDTLTHTLCRQLQINATDFNALRHLVFGAPLTPGGLAGKLSISSAASSALVDRLSARGHVVRTPHPSDRRSVLVHASPETVGLMVSALRPIFQEPHEHLNHATPENQQAVVAFLEDVLHSIQVHSESRPAGTPAKQKGRS